MCVFCKCGALLKLSPVDDLCTIYVGERELR
jgi:hypothetical protein